MFCQNMDHTGHNQIVLLCVDDVPDGGNQVMQRCTDPQ
jgi:hypothetical protein